MSGIDEKIAHHGKASLSDRIDGAIIALGEAPRRSRVDGLHAQAGCTGELHVGGDQLSAEVLCEHRRVQLCDERLIMDQ